MLETVAITDAKGKLKTMGQIEREVIVVALGKCNGNAREAAKLLQLGQATVYRKMNRYGLVKSDFSKKKTEDN